MKLRRTLRRIKKDDDGNQQEVQRLEPSISGGIGSLLATTTPLLSLWSFCQLQRWFSLVLVLVWITSSDAAAAYPAPTPSPTYTAAPTGAPTITAVPTSAFFPSPCTVCVNGKDRAYLNRSRAFTVPGLLAQTCGDLLNTVGLFQEDSSVCNSIRTLGTFCGCPSQRHSCTVTFNGQPVDVNFSQKVLPDTDALQYNIFGASSGTKLNCEMLDSAIRFLAMENETVCRETRRNYSNSCSFIRRPPTVGSGGNGGYDFNDYQNATESYQPCSVCLDGSHVQFPNKTIRLGALPVRNCSQLETLSYIFHTNDTQCLNIQLMGPYCGCPVKKRACSFCPNGEHVPFPNRPFPLLKNFQGLPPGFIQKVASDLTCGQYESILDIDLHNANGIDPEYACLVGQFRSGECGCSRGYREALVSWLFRASAILSLVGSFFIVRDVMAKAPERRTTYHHLILGTTCFDVISSIAYMLSGVLLPPPGYEAHGNHATCVLQGVLIQLGLTSLFYSLLLSIYYLLMIKYNWKESKFRKYRKSMHVPIVAIGIALAAASSTSIAPQLGFCYIAVPPEAANRIRITLLYVVPTSIALVVIFGSTLLTCYFVYSTERAALKWSAKRNLSMTKKVCWQSFWYCIGFAVTVPCVILNYYGDFRSSDHFWLLATATFFAPSQGFLNTLVYFHRASKGSSSSTSTLGKLFGSCCRWRRPEGKLSSSTEGRPSQNTESFRTEPLTVSQEPISEATSQLPSISELDTHHRGHPDDSVLTETNQGDDNRSDSQNDDSSELFSAAAAHWLMEIGEESNVVQPQAAAAATRRNLASSVTIPRSIFASFRRQVSTR